MTTTTTSKSTIAAMERSSRAADARYEAECVALSKLQARVERPRLLFGGNPNVKLDPPATDEERLEARARLPHWEQELAEHELTAGVACREAETQREVLRRARLDLLRVEHEGACRDVAEALLRHGRPAVDRLIEIEDRIASVEAGSERLAALWAGLSSSPDPARFTPALEGWIEYVQRAYAFEIKGTT